MTLQSERVGGKYVNVEEKEKLQFKSIENDKRVLSFYNTV